MSEQLDIALKRAAEGCRIRFQQNFYGRQTVKISGGWKFWLSRTLELAPDEIIRLKESLPKHRKS